VTLTAPEPKSFSTKVSATIGMRRPVSGSSTSLADQVAVALVVGVDRDAGVAEHGLGPRRRDHDHLIRADHRVAQLPQEPSSSTVSTSRSLTTVWLTGSQLIIRLAR
jgi:hypothetical protein